jgi:hypothetical protein
VTGSHVKVFNYPRKNGVTQRPVAVRRCKTDLTPTAITLSSECLAFFKEAAKKHHTQYQKTIRQLLDE